MRNKFNLGIILFLVLIIILLIPLILAADSGMVPVTGTGSGGTSGTSDTGASSQAQQLNQGTNDISKYFQNMQASVNVNSGSQATFTPNKDGGGSISGQGDFSFSYQQKGSEGKLTGQEQTLSFKGLGDGSAVNIKQDSMGNPYIADGTKNIEIGKDSGKDGTNARFEGSEQKLHQGDKIESVNKNPEGKTEVNIKPDSGIIQEPKGDGKTEFKYDLGNKEKEFTLKDYSGNELIKVKGDELTHTGKNWQIEPGKTVTSITPNSETKIPVSADKSAAKFFPDGKIPESEKGSAAAVGKDGKVSVQGSQLESSPKVEISAKDKYTSLQAGKGSNIEYSIDPKTSFPVIKPSGSSWTIIDGNKEYKGINGKVYSNTLTNPPSGMSAEEFGRIKGSEGLEIIPLDSQGKPSFLDSKGNPYKIVINPNNPKGYDVFDINHVSQPRVSYGTNPPGGVVQPIAKTLENPYGFDINKVPDYSKYDPKDTYVQSKNFIVYSARGNAQAYAAALEYWRYKQSVELTGKGHPPWSQPARVTIREGMVGNGGATTFYFQGKVVYGWNMDIQGSQARLLDSVIPHEVTHMISAGELSQPLPRWADEGSASAIENPAEKVKYYSQLYNSLRTGGGYSFNQMITMMEYPRSNSAMLTLYGQGLSVVEYMDTLKDPSVAKRERFETMREAMTLGNTQQAWQTAIRNHYGFNTLREFQQAWNNWLNKKYSK